jgi:dihydrofolate synthase/folylpolyglutamate synthase
VRWPARLEVIAGAPLVVLDCAHNAASAEALVETLTESLPVQGPRVLVFASSGDKDVAGMFRVLAPAFECAFLTRYTSNPRWFPPEELRQLWEAAGGGPVTLIGSPAETLDAARAKAGPAGLVCVTGSVYLAGDLRPLLVENPR